MLCVCTSIHFLYSRLFMEKYCTVLTVHTHLASSTDLKNFIELLTPMAIGLSNQININSNKMKNVVTTLSKYVSSPYDGQRVAIVGLFSRLVSLKPCGEVSLIVMNHLTSALSNPNAVVRGLSIQDMGYVGLLAEEDIKKYDETAITALLKGIDDTERCVFVYNKHYYIIFQRHFLNVLFFSDCLINISLESMRGLARILQNLPSDRVESFHVSLAIRICPFFGSYFFEIREAAIILFGDLCQSKMSLNDGAVSPNSSNEALREQLIANLFPLLLHLSEGESTIIRVI